jgi:hypothetical protein
VCRPGVSLQRPAGHVRRCVQTTPHDVYARCLPSPCAPPCAAATGCSAPPPCCGGGCCCCQPEQHVHTCLLPATSSARGRPPSQEFPPSPSPSPSTSPSSSIRPGPPRPTLPGSRGSLDAKLVAAAGFLQREHADTVSTQADTHTRSHRRGSRGAACMSRRHGHCVLPACL